MTVIRECDCGDCRTCHRAMGFTPDGPAAGVAVTTVNTYGDPGADPAEEWTGHLDPAAGWDRQAAPQLPPPPPGHADWEQVDQRTWYRAWKDDLPCITVDFVHGDRHITSRYIAHYRSKP